MRKSKVVFKAEVQEHHFLVDDAVRKVHSGNVPSFYVECMRVRNEEGTTKCTFFFKV